MVNKIIIGVASVLATIGFLFLVYQITNKPTVSSFPDVSKISVNDHIKWSPEKKNILVEYSDLQCPACKAFHNLIKAMEGNSSGSSPSAEFKIGQKVTFVYRHFPLAQHENADEAAYAAEAAGKQGKFYEMTDKLFETQDDWSKDSDPKKKFVTYAGELKLDLDQFKKDMESKAVKDKVKADLNSGTKFQVLATPTFYLNGEKLDNIRSFEEFSKLLEEL